MVTARMMATRISEGIIVIGTTFLYKIILYRTLCCPQEEDTAGETEEKKDI